MSALVSALDNHTPIQFGENGHAEYAWSHNVQERIAQLHMQITRTDLVTIENLGDIFDSIICDIQLQYKSDKISKEKMIDMLSVMYKMFGLTRDMIDGKGEYAIAYMLIYRWYAFYPELSVFALECCVSLEPDIHPFGSWKDIKYFCNYCKNMSGNENHPLIHYAIHLVNSQLRNDVNASKASLAGKWIPREKSSKFGWLFQKLAVDYFFEYTLTAKNPQQEKSARLKCFTKYREICSKLNKQLDTVQIKQCAKEWVTIDPTKQTSITMHKQKNAFLNKCKTPNTQRSEEEDRVQCAINFREYIEKVKTGEAKINGKRIGLNDFTKNALELLIYCGEDTSEKDILNAQWRDNSTQTGALGDMVAMVDVSGSMEGDPLNVAIALGCRVAEKSKLGKRVITFSSNPSWVNLDDCDEFTDMVGKLQHADWGQSTDIYKAFALVLDAIESANLTHEEVEKMIFAIFSDMQIDYCSEESRGDNRKVLFKKISDLYAERGIQLTGTPFKPPHLLFWNLRSSTGTPVLSTEQNVSIMSGFSASLLNLYCDKGIDALQSASPWSMLIEAVSNERYHCLGEKIIEVLL
jgi:hypothetical protein